MASKSEILEVISRVTPGTKLREGVFNILDGGKGGLIVVGLSDEIKKMVDGGFLIDCDYTPERLFELAKMDGAIILDDNVEKIYYANVHLHPNKTYVTTESGTRHRTAERMARQTDKLIIAISERKKRVTLYKGEFKYYLKQIEVVLDQANQALKTLEKYKSVLEKELKNLTQLELEDLVTLNEVASVAQRFEMVYRIKHELKSYVVELGEEGRLIHLQLEELLLNVRAEKIEFIKDYYNDEENELDIEAIYDKLGELSDIELLELEKFVQILGYKKTAMVLEHRVIPKGYRFLSKISKLSKKDVEKIILEYDNLAKLQEATEEELMEVKGLSRFKVKAIHSKIKGFKIEE